MTKQELFKDFSWFNPEYVKDAYKNGLKVLLVTHNDMDGSGPVVILQDMLGKLAEKTGMDVKDLKDVVEVQHCSNGIMSSAITKAAVKGATTDEYVAVIACDISCTDDIKKTYEVVQSDEASRVDLIADGAVKFTIPAECIPEFPKEASVTLTEKDIIDRLPNRDTSFIKLQTRQKYDLFNSEEKEGFIDLKAGKWVKYTLPAESIPEFPKIQSITLTDAEIIDRLPNLNLIVIDHHETAEHLNKYDWAAVKKDMPDDTYRQNLCSDDIPQERRLSSGTSLLYDFMENNGFTSTNEEHMKNLVHVIASYDTWMWKNEYTDAEICSEVNSLLYIYGAELFEEKFLNYLQKEKAELIDEVDLYLLAEKKEEEKQYVNEREKNFQIAELELGGRTHKVIAGEANSHLPAVFERMQDKEKYPGIDIAIVLSDGKIGFRPGSAGLDDPTINLAQIASIFGGGGHPQASGISFYKTGQGRTASGNSIEVLNPPLEIGKVFGIEKNIALIVGAKPLEKIPGYKDVYFSTKSSDLPKVEITDNFKNVSAQIKKRNAVEAANSKENGYSSRYANIKLGDKVYKVLVTTANEYEDAIFERLQGRHLTDEEKEAIKTEAKIENKPINAKELNSKSVSRFPDADIIMIYSEENGKISIKQGYKMLQEENPDNKFALFATELRKHTNVTVSPKSIEVAIPAKNPAEEVAKKLGVEYELVEPEMKFEDFSIEKQNLAKSIVNSRFGGIPDKTDKAKEKQKETMGAPKVKPSKHSASPVMKMQSDGVGTAV